MRIQYSLPDNKQFFNRYATLIPTLSKLGILAQIISAITEIGIIYGLIYSRVLEVSPGNAQLFSICGAIIGTLFLELGIRKFTPYSINAFLYKRFSGLDFVMTIFILLVTCSFFFASSSLSFRGSKEIIKVIQPSLNLESTISIDKEFADQKKELNQIYTRDSARITSGYRKQIEASNKEYVALIQKEQSKLNQYQRKEQKTGSSFQTKKEKIKEKIASLEAINSNKIGHLEALQATELDLISKEYKNDLKDSKSLYVEKINATEEANLKITTNSESSTALYGNSLAWFTIVCLLIYLFSAIIEAVHRKGSGIRQIALPNQYYFSESIISDFQNMVNEKLNYKARLLIQKFAEQTPLPPHPIAPPVLYDFAKIKQQRVVFLTNEIPQQEIQLNYSLPTQVGKPLRVNSTNEIQDLELQILDYLKAFFELEKQNLHEQAKEMQLKADDVIKVYLGDSANQEKIEDLRNLIIGYLNGENDNPFSQIKRNPIGFNKPTDNTDENKIKMPIRQPYNVPKSETGERICQHCKQTYIYKQNTQKFCNEKCRIAAWQRKTGKELRKKKKK